MDLLEGLDSLDSQAFLGNQEDQEDQVIFSEKLAERTHMIKQYFQQSVSERKLLMIISEQN